MLAIYYILHNFHMNHELPSQPEKGRGRGMAKPGTTTTKEPTYNKLTVVMCTAVLVTSSTCQVQFRFLITTLGYYRQTWKGKPALHHPSCRVWESAVGQTHWQILQKKEPSSYEEKRPRTVNSVAMTCFQPLIFWQLIRNCFVPYFLYMIT